MHWLRQPARDFPPAIIAEDVPQQNADKRFECIHNTPCTNCVVETNIVISLHTKVHFIFTFVHKSIWYICGSWKGVFREIQYSKNGAVLTVLTPIKYVCPLIMTCSRSYAFITPFSVG